MGKILNTFLITLAAVNPQTITFSSVDSSVEKPKIDPLEQIVTDLKKSAVCIRQMAVYFKDGAAVIRTKTFTGIAIENDYMNRAYIITSIDQPSKMMPTPLGKEVLDLAEVNYFVVDKNDNLPLDLLEDNNPGKLLRTRNKTRIKAYKDYLVEPDIVLQDATSPLVILKVLVPDTVYAPACDRSGLRKEKPVEGIINNRGYDKNHFEATFNDSISTIGGPVFIIRPEGTYFSGLLDEQSKDGNGVVTNVKDLYNLFTTK